MAINPQFPSPDINQTRSAPPDPAWKDKAFKTSVQIRQGFEGFMLGKIMEQHDEVMKLARETRYGKLGQTQPEGKESDDVGTTVSLGNEHIINYNYYGGTLNGHQNGNVVDEGPVEQETEKEETKQEEASPVPTPTPEPVKQEPQIVERIVEKLVEVKVPQIVEKEKIVEVPKPEVVKVSDTRIEKEGNGWKTGLLAGALALGTLGAGTGVIALLNGNKPSVDKPPEIVDDSPNGPTSISPDDWKARVFVTRPGE
jgi:hypothetical protein